MISLLALAALVPVCVQGAAIAQTFVAPADCPTCTSDFYVGQSNGSLPISPVVKGKAFDRFIQIWLENTNYAVAASNPQFQAIAKKGITLSQYNGVTHPSEPNYIASIAGDFFGMADDDVYFVDSNVSTVVDLLEAKNVSWATYQENMPTDAFQGDYAQANYFNSSAPAYTYYKRKHNPFAIFNSVANETHRAERIRNFNDFAVDVNASALAQYVYITPNLVNDGHDTSNSFLGNWVDYFLTPLLSNSNFNDNRTLILLTFDENEDYGSQNTVFTVLLGGSVPNASIGTTDPTFYTHYSTLSTVENNWDLGNLGRQDVNETVSNVFAPFNIALNYTNNGWSLTNNSGIPFTNETGIFAGVLNTELWVPIPAPVDTPGAGGGATFFSPLVNRANLSTSSAPSPINLTAMGLVNPAMINPNISALTTSAGTSSSSSTSSSSNGTASGTTTKASGAALSVNVGRGALGAVVLGGMGLVGLMI
ncbi:phosphoesterase family-domain-containing protein [Mrakia frigida]|uniref:phosphoesterase family-domain-containing protein n=1 Tax=Mrakia frigida TaxID=29902 RepID=UPI003FCC2031